MEKKHLSITKHNLMSLNRPHIYHKGTPTDSTNTNHLTLILKLYYYLHQYGLIDEEAEWTNGG